MAAGLQLYDSEMAEKNPLLNMVEVVKRISMPPSYAKKVPEGIIEALNGIVYTYLPEFDGFVLSYRSPPGCRNTVFKVETGLSILTFDVHTQLCIFKPVVGACLCATVCKVKEGIASCMLYGCIQISVQTRSPGVAVGDNIRVRIVNIEEAFGSVLIHGEEVVTVKKGADLPPSVSEAGSESFIAQAGDDSPTLERKRLSRKHFRFEGKNNSSSEEESNPCKRRKAEPKQKHALESKRKQALDSSRKHVPQPPRKHALDSEDHCSDSQKQLHPCKRKRMDPSSMGGLDCENDCNDSNDELNHCQKGKSM